MLDIVLYEPEIPPNTGNIIRLAANTGFGLHLIQPLGFELDDKRMRRAGLDYSEFTRIQLHTDWQAYHAWAADRTIYALSTKGTQRYDQAPFNAGDQLLFGPETRGLPAPVRESLPQNQVLRLPMQAQSRSLNLSNSVSIVVYEAWRQLNFDGGL